MIKTIIEVIKKLFNSNSKQKEIKKSSSNKTNKQDNRTIEEKIFSSGDELLITDYLHRQAEKRGLTDKQLNSNFEKTYTEKIDKKRAIKFEIVPYLQANRNVRTYLEYTTGNFDIWKSIRDNVENKNNGVCCICGISSKELGKSYNTECHEVWFYITDKTRKQKLIRLEPLCNMCHQIKHINQHEHDKELFNLLMERYCEINNIDIEQGIKDYKNALYWTKQRKNDKFKLDISILKEYGIKEEIFDCHNNKFNLWLENWKEKNKEKE